MTHRRIIAVFGLALLVVTAGCLGGAQAAGADDSTTRTIDVSGSSTIYASPDEAVLVVAIEKKAFSAGDVRDQLAAAADDLTGSLEAAGVPEGNVVTARYDVNVVREENGDTTYLGVHAFRVVTGDVENVGDLVDVALANGANRVNGVQFRLSPDARQGLYHSALREALTEARANADTLADEAGLSIATVEHVSASNGGYVYAEAGGAAARTDVRPSQVAVTAHVSVSYSVE